MKTSLFAASLVVLATTIEAQTLDTIVVTADRLPRALGRTPSAVTVFTGDALRAAGVRDIVSLVKLVPGAATARSGSDGAQTSLFLRGGESDYVRVLVDGVSVNDPGGAVDLSRITLDNVDRVEIVRGPASVLYGSDAVTGVVQIFTRDARAGREAALDVRTGNRGTSRMDGSAGLVTRTLVLSTGLSRHRTDGWLAFNNEFRVDAASARLTFVPDAATRAVFATRLSDNVFHYPTDAAGSVVDRNSRRSDRRGTLSAQLSRTIGSRTELVVDAGAFDAHGRTTDASDASDDTVGFYAYSARSLTTRRSVDARVHVRAAPTATISAGGEWLEDGLRSTDSSNFSSSPSRFDESRSNRAAYVQVVGDWQRLSYSAGGRYDDNERFGSFRTHRVAASLAVTTNTRLRGALGTAFKAPTFLEHFNTVFTTGNADLQPERARSWELAIEQRLAGDRVSLSASWFDQHFENLIQYRFSTDPGPNYFNVAAASARGVEVEGALSLARGLDLSASTTLLRTRVEDAGFDSGPGATFVAGQRLLRRPAQTANATLTTTRLGRATAWLAWTWVGKRDDRDFSVFPAEPLVLGAYSRVDVAMSHPLTRAARALEATLRVENVFGTRFEEVYNFPAPGRVVLVGLRASMTR